MAALQRSTVPVSRSHGLVERSLPFSLQDDFHLGDGDLGERGGEVGRSASSGSLKRGRSGPHTLPRTRVEGVSAAQRRAIDSLKTKMNFDQDTDEELPKAPASSTPAGGSRPAAVSNGNRSNLDGEASLDQSQLVERLLQIRDYLKQSETMVDSIQKEPHTPRNKEQLSRVLDLAKHLEDQEAGYLGLLHEAMSSESQRSLLMNRSQPNGEREEAEEDPGQERRRGSDESESIILDYQSDFSEATTNDDEAEKMKELEALKDQRNVLKKMLEQQKQLKKLHEHQAQLLSVQQEEQDDRMRLAWEAKSHAQAELQEELQLQQQRNQRQEEAASEGVTPPSERDAEESEEMRRLHIEKEHLTGLLAQARVKKLALQQASARLGIGLSEAGLGDWDTRGVGKMVGSAGIAVTASEVSNSEVTTTEVDSSDSESDDEEEEEEGVEEGESDRKPNTEDVLAMKNRLLAMLKGLESIDQLVEDGNDSLPPSTSDSEVPAENEAPEFTVEDTAEIEDMSEQRRDLQRKLDTLKEKKARLDEVLADMSILRETRSPRSARSAPAAVSRINTGLGDSRASDSESMTSSLVHLHQSQDASNSANQTAGRAETVLEVMQTESKFRKLDELKGRLKQLSALSQYYAAGRQFIHEQGDTGDSETEDTSAAVTQEEEEEEEEEGKTSALGASVGTDVSVGTDILSSIMGGSQDLSLLGNLDLDRLVGEQGLPAGGLSRVRGETLDSDVSSQSPMDDTASLMSEAMREYKDDSEIQQRLQVLQEAKSRLAELKMLVADGEVPDVSHLDDLTDMLTRHGSSKQNTLQSSEKQVLKALHGGSPTTGSLGDGKLLSPLGEAVSGRFPRLNPSLSLVTRNHQSSGTANQHTAESSGFRGQLNIHDYDDGDEEDHFPKGSSDIQDESLADLFYKLKMLEVTKETLRKRQDDLYKKAVSNESERGSARSGALKGEGTSSSGNTSARRGAGGASEVTFQEPPAEYEQDYEEYAEEVSPIEPRSNDRLWGIMREQRIAQEELRQKIHDMEVAMGRAAPGVDGLGTSVYSGGATQATWGSARCSDSEDDSSSDSDSSESESESSWMPPERPQQVNGIAPTSATQDDGYPGDGPGQAEEEEEEEETRGKPLPNRRAFARLKRSSTPPSGGESSMDELHRQLGETSASCQQLMRDQQRLTQLIQEQSGGEGPTQHSPLATAEHRATASGLSPSAAAQIAAAAAAAASAAMTAGGSQSVDHEQCTIRSAAVSHCLGQLQDQKRVIEQLSSHVGQLTDHVQYLEEELVIQPHQHLAIGPREAGSYDVDRLDYALGLDPREFLGSSVSTGEILQPSGKPASAAVGVNTTPTSSVYKRADNSGSAGLGAAGRRDSRTPNQRNLNMMASSEEKGNTRVPSESIPPLNMKRLLRKQAGTYTPTDSVRSDLSYISEPRTSPITKPSPSAIATGRHQVAAATVRGPYSSLLYKPGLSAGISGTAYDDSAASSVRDPNSVSGTPKHTAASLSSLMYSGAPVGSGGAVLSSPTGRALFNGYGADSPKRQELLDGIAKVVSDIESETDAGSNLSLFEALRETIYSEVATLISQNEERPHYLIELFRQLQLFTSDYLRQSALYAHRELVSKFIQESASLAGSTSSINAPSHTNNFASMHSSAAMFPRGGSALAPEHDGTPSESLVTSDDDELKSYSVPAALARAQAAPAGCAAVTGPTGQTLRRVGSVANERFDYIEVADTASATSALSTPPPPLGGTWFAEEEPLEETVINLTEAMERVRQYEKEINDDGDEKSEVGEKSKDGASAASSAYGDDGAKDDDDASDRTVELMTSRVDTHSLDLHIRTIMSEVIPVMKNHVGDVCSPALLSYIKDLVLALTERSELAAQQAADSEPSGDSSPATGATAAVTRPDINKGVFSTTTKSFFSDQLSPVLRDTMSKYSGQQLKDCAQAMLMDISEVLFNELAFSKLMEELAARGGGAIGDGSTTAASETEASDAGSEGEGSEVKDSDVADTDQQKTRKRRRDRARRLQQELDDSDEDNSENSGDDESESGESEGESEDRVSESSAAPAVSGEDRVVEGSDGGHQAAATASGNLPLKNGENTLGSGEMSEGLGIEDSTVYYALLTSETKSMNIIGSDEDSDSNEGSNRSTPDGEQSDTAVSREAQREKQETNHPGGDNLGEEGEPPIMLKVNQSEILTKMQTESLSNSKVSAALSALPSDDQLLPTTASDSIPAPPPSTPSAADDMSAGATDDEKPAQS